ncbi:MAG: hypothetical protein RCO49_07830 [Rickettsia endosymbiont of Argas persicus]
MSASRNFNISYLTQHKNKKFYDLDEIYLEEVNQSSNNKLNDEFIGHNGNVYQYNKNMDTYIPLTGVDLSHG